MGMTFQAFRGSSGAQIAFTILLATSIGDRVTQCTAHERGVANAVKVGQNHFFLENKVVINFKNLFPFPRTVQLKISLGPIRFLDSKFHGLLTLIFHTNQYNGA